MGRHPATACLTTGELLALGGILLAVVPLNHGTIPKWNGLCSSGTGRLLSPSARDYCTVAVAVHAIGRLIGLGIATLAAGAVLTVTPPVGQKPDRAATPAPCGRRGQPPTAYSSGRYPPCRRRGQLYVGRVHGRCLAPSACSSWRISAS
jgi:hypothetical protein